MSLGVKGSDKTMGAVTGVRKGLKDAQSTALETKVALLGVMYAMEKLFAASGKTGTDLTNFSAVTGLSAQTLQKYQYAAGRAGVANDEVTKSFIDLQKAMTDIQLNGVAPEGLQQMSKVLGEDINMNTIDAWKKNPEEAIQALQRYAKLETDFGMKQRVLGSFGQSAGMQAALNRQEFTQANFAKAPTYSDKELAQLDKANIAWADLSKKIEMAVGHFNALHGGQLVKEFSAIADKVITLAASFVKLADKIELFKKIGMVFEGWGEIFDGITAAVDAINKLKGPDSNETHQDTKSPGGALTKLGFGAGLSGGVNESRAEIDAGNAQLVDFFASLVGKLFMHTGGMDAKAFNPSLHAVPTPNALPLPPGSRSGATVTQTFNFHKDMDAPAVGTEAGRQVNNALRQSSVQSRAN